MPLATAGGRSSQDGILIDRDSGQVQGFLGLFSGDGLDVRSTSAEMVIRSPETILNPRVTREEARFWHCRQPGADRVGTLRSMPPEKATALAAITCIKGSP
jgi:hypothetical protein